MNDRGIKALVILGQMMLSSIYIASSGRRLQQAGGRLQLPRLFLLWVAVSFCLLLLVAGGVL